MHFILSTGLAEAGASFGNGGPESGPQAVLRAFAPLCERLAAQSGGSVAVVDGAAEARAALQRAGRADAVHLCFALPDQAFALAGCRTVPVFGWGLGSLPVAAGAQGGPDWRVPLAAHGSAIGLSAHTTAAVRAAMGADFDVATVLPPSAPYTAAATAPEQGAPIGHFRILDTASWTQQRPPVVAFDAQDDLADAVAATPGEEVLFRTPPPWRKTWRFRLGTTRLHARLWYREALADLMPGPVNRAGALATRGLARAAHAALARRRQAPRQLAAPAAEGGADAWVHAPLALSGTVFSAVHGMWDRSWSDAVSAFVWTFRDTPSATLLIRSTGVDPGTREALAGYLRRLLPFRCRVVLVDAHLTDAQADALADASAFYVCASHAEAAPLPLMRHLARGRPAVSPVHSALAGIVDGDCAVLVDSSVAHDYWPNDPGERLLTSSHRLDWESLCQAFRAACDLAAAPGAYARMQRQAAARMATLDAESAANLAGFLGLGAAAQAGRAA